MENKLTKIMLIENEADIRAIARYALEKIGQFTVAYCASGEEALQQVEEFLPDLILLDVMMPGKDGIATMQALQQIPLLKNTLIVFMTARVQIQEIKKYRELGAADVIAKPFDPMKLAERLKMILEKGNE